MKVLILSFNYQSIKVPNMVNCLFQIAKYNNLFNSLRILLCNKIIIRIEKNKPHWSNLYFFYKIFQFVLNAEHQASQWHTSTVSKQ